MSTQRKPISKKIRFEVFKRDGYKCAYCGNSTPNCVLEIDHIIPVSKGGKNIIENLLTSCFDCNRGKGKNKLSSIPASVINNVIIEKERLAQYNEYVKFYKQKIKIDDYTVNIVEEAFTDCFENSSFSKSFRKSVLRFINELGVDDVYKAMSYSCSKITEKNAVIKYFCAICWNKIGGK